MRSGRRISASITSWPQAATVVIVTRIAGADLVEIRSKMPAEIYAASMEMYKALWRHGRLDTRLRELLRLKSAGLAGCDH